MGGDGGLEGQFSNLEMFLRYGQQVLLTAWEWIVTTSVKKQNSAIYLKI